MGLPRPHNRERSGVDLSQGAGLIDKHNRYIILDMIDQPAVMTDELLLIFAILQFSGAAGIPHALGAGKNIKQFPFECHGILLYAVIAAVP